MSFQTEDLKVGHEAYLPAGGYTGDYAEPVGDFSWWKITGITEVGEHDVRIEGHSVDDPQVKIDITVSRYIVVVYPRNYEEMADLTTDNEVGDGA